jgi:Fe-S-cluster containining protein
VSANDDATGSPSARRPWYAEGVRFSCRPDCGKCCTRHGDYDYVYLEPGDVRRLAAHFDMTVRAFRAKWTKKDDGHTVLRMDGPACPFLEGTRCSVYGARPSQCGSFPFWPENLESRGAWDGLAEFCPGVGEGELVPLHVIREQLRSRPGS